MIIDTDIFIQYTICLNINYYLLIQYDIPINEKWESFFFKKSLLYV